MSSEGCSLWESVADGGALAGRLLSRDEVVPLSELGRASSLGGRLEELRGRSVLLLTRSQLTAALALIELDGVARRLVLCPPDLARADLAGVVRGAQADACVRDGATSGTSLSGISTCVAAQTPLWRGEVSRRRSHVTEWVLLTSGTAGAPKLALHTLASLTSALARQAPASSGALVWSTFYDIRRYGGLQSFMRALHDGSLLLSHPSEPVSEFLGRAAAAGVTHISGTPSHWRRALMSGLVAGLAPRYVRLSGEIADQGVLDSLRGAFPGATVAHAFASTEAGVAFEVRDGLAGFPASLLDEDGPVALRVVADTLRIRSPGTAQRYLGEDAAPLRGPDGFVDTGDRIEQRDGRCYFMGRRDGVINVGGLKVHPEEVEAVLNAHSWVRMSLVRARRNPILGAVITAEVVLADMLSGQDPRPGAATLTAELAEACRRSLAPHKVPVTIHFVPSLEVSAAGKLVRPVA